MALLKTKKVKDVVYTTQRERPFYPDYSTEISGKTFYILKHQYLSKVIWVEVDAETGEEFNENETKTDLVNSIYYRERVK